MGEAIAFYTLSAFILGFAMLVVTTKDTVHSVLFLVLDFLFVAALYVLLGAEFLAAIQVLVYAGGIVVLYLFVVMLVNLKRPAEAYQDPHRRTTLGYGLAAAALVEFALRVFARACLRDGGRQFWADAVDAMQLFAGRPQDCRRRTEPLKEKRRDP